MGRVRRLKIENFKSYEQKLEIGPFIGPGGLTCIIGPNGSGKSNLMDAFAFVLGLSHTVLRVSSSSRMTELIHRKPHEGEDAVRKRMMKVELEFEKDSISEESRDPEGDDPHSIQSKSENNAITGSSGKKRKRQRSPDIDNNNNNDNNIEENGNDNNDVIRSKKNVSTHNVDETGIISSQSMSRKTNNNNNNNNNNNVREGEIIRFARVVSGETGQAKYLFNQKQVTQEIYLQELSKIGILTKARNFLVFQGDVESLTLKQGLELTSFFESICGSDGFKKECEKLEKEKAQADEVARYLFTKKRGAILEKKSVEKAAEEAEQFQTSSDELSFVKQEYWLFRLNQMDHEYAKHDANFLKIQSEKAILDGKFAKELEASKNLEKELNALSKKLALSKKHLEDSGKSLIASSAGKGHNDNSNAFAAAFPSLALANKRRTGNALDACMDAEFLKLKSEENFLKLELEDRERQLASSKNKSEVYAKNLASLTADKARVKEKIDLTKKKIAECKIELTAEQQAEYERNVEACERGMLLEPQGGNNYVGSSNAVVGNDNPTGAANSSLDLKEQLRVVEHKMRVLNGELKEKSNESETWEARKNNLLKKIEDLNEQATHLESQTAAHGHAFREKKERLLQVKAELDQDRERKGKLTAERGVHMEKLQTANFSQRQLLREQRLITVAEELARSLGADRVFGRVCDLVKPAEKKYMVAVNVALGGYSDSILVDTAKTCKLCVQYLKKHQIEPLTFIPITKPEDLRISVNASSLAKIAQNPQIFEKKGVRQCLNCINYDRRKYGRGMDFILGNTLVCKNLDVARSVAFGDFPKFGISGLRIVTQDGEMIKPNGNMTVNSDAAREGGTKFDMKATHKAAAKVDEIADALNAIMRRELRNNTERAGLDQEVMQGHSKVQEWNLRLNRVREEIAQKKGELQKVVQKELSLTESIESVQKDIEDSEKAISEISEKISKNMRGYFRKLSEELGVDCIRTKDLEMQRQREKLHNEEVFFLKQLGKVEAELQIVNDGIATCERQRAKKKEIEEMGKKLEDLSKQVSDYEKNFRKEQAEVAKTATELEALRKKEVARTKKEVVSKQQKLQEVRCNRDTMARYKIECFRHIVMDNVQLPLLNEKDSLRKILRKSESAASASSSGTNILGTGDSTADSNSLGLTEVEERLARLAVDYSQLPEERQATVLGRSFRDNAAGLAAEILRMSNEYEECLDALQKDLEKLRPNMKASSKIDDAEQDLVRRTTEAENARKKSEQLEKQCKELKQQRRTRFLECFNHVQREINHVYRELTSTYETCYNSGHYSATNNNILANKSSCSSGGGSPDSNVPNNDESSGNNNTNNRAGKKGDHQRFENNENDENNSASTSNNNIKKSSSSSSSSSSNPTGLLPGGLDILVDEGGRAFLDLENPEWPFDGGIKYTTMAPSKRFRDMHLLSGGEKTLAALALLFAVHSYQQPPFMILDEVDAALDYYNVQSIRRFLQKAPFQSLVISLKDKFFSQAEGLVGVYKNKKADCSGILTLDLRKYRLSCNNGGNVASYSNGTSSTTRGVVGLLGDNSSCKNINSTNYEVLTGTDGKVTKHYYRSTGVERLIDSGNNNNSNSNTGVLIGGGNLGEQQDSSSSIAYNSTSKKNIGMSSGANNYRASSGSLLPGVVGVAREQPTGGIFNDITNSNYSKSTLPMNNNYNGNTTNNNSDSGIENINKVKNTSSGNQKDSKNKTENNANNNSYSAAFSSAGNAENYDVVMQD